jgi:hypothetical protein
MSQIFSSSLISTILFVEKMGGNDREEMRRKNKINLWWINSRPNGVAWVIDVHGEEMIAFNFV